MLRCSSGSLPYHSFMHLQYFDRRRQFSDMVFFFISDPGLGCGKNPHWRTREGGREDDWRPVGQAVLCGVYLVSWAELSLCQVHFLLQCHCNLAQNKLKCDTCNLDHVLCTRLINKICWSWSEFSFWCCSFTCVKSKMMRVRQLVTLFLRWISGCIDKTCWAQSV